MLSIEKLKSLVLAINQNKFRIIVLDVKKSELDLRSFEDDINRLIKYKCPHKVIRANGQVILTRSFSPDELDKWKELKKLMKTAKGTFRKPELTIHQAKFYNYLALGLFPRFSGNKNYRGAKL